MKKYNIIEVAFKDGTSTLWNAENGDWDDYIFEGNAFIVKDKAGAWVGIYNFDCIHSVIIK